jgi:tRNA A37 threonylcarbamoyladenosine modification protein TsaB
MLVLAIDTSSHQVLCEIAGEAGVLCSRRTPVSSFVAETHDLVLAALREADCRLSDIGLLCAVTGPGASWTGIRVGTTLIKTLGFATGTPAVGLPQLPFVAAVFAPDLPAVTVLSRERTGFVAAGDLDTTRRPPRALSPTRVIPDSAVAARLEGSRSALWYAPSAPPEALAGRVTAARPAEIPPGALAAEAMAALASGAPSDPHELRTAYFGNFPA